MVAEQAGALSTRPVTASSRLCIDLMKTWRAPAEWTPERIAELTGGMKALVASYVNRAYPVRAADAKGPTPSIDAARVRRAVDFLDERPERWETFLRAVNLHVDAGDPRSVFEELQCCLAEDSRAAGVDANALAYRLVFEVTQAGAKPDLEARHLLGSSLEALIEGVRAKLLDWMRSAHPERLWQLDLVADLRRRVEQLEGGRASGTASKELRARHLTAVRRQCAAFRVLGFDSDIPIADAWPLDARWSDAPDAGATTFHAHRVLESPHRMAILVAEGGGGKSTVLRRIAFEAAGRNVLVVRAHAKNTVRTRRRRADVRRGAPKGHCRSIRRHVQRSCAA